MASTTGPARVRRDLPPWAGGAIGITAVLVAWSLVSTLFFGSGGIVPAPWAVLEQLGATGFSTYWGNLSVTTASAAQGWLWGNLVALAIAVVVLLVPPLEGAANQVAVISYCIPMTAIGPIVLIVSPPGSRTTSVFLASMSVVFTSVVGCLLGLRAADRTALDVVQAYGGSRWTALVKVRLTAALPNVLAALKLAAPAAFLGAVLGEYFGGVDSGLGIMVVAAQTNLQYAQIWALALLSGAVAGAGYLLIGLLARLLTPWSSTGVRTGEL
ncbi:ABC transporter permease [Kineococcus aurantiacus]|uniref:ABC-type nitrate/sulfonate/bicarbonate transport system permease component n=1 Tax=Kineococcus aurantiacus TaxID=37633 RepID=A0A7Y9J2Q3_9ACTN|nr:ABC transporter permease subunit [Kineococcus aurantiacus]NYD24502.1 ABC-type nitrate/sulfonate/bicarbonate transport system permease component [Kineococcus aurantiacus]